MLISDVLAQGARAVQTKLDFDFVDVEIAIQLSPVRSQRSDSLAQQVASLVHGPVGRWAVLTAICF